MCADPQLYRCISHMDTAALFCCLPFFCVRPRVSLSVRFLRVCCRVGTYKLNHLGSRHILILERRAPTGFSWSWVQPSSLRCALGINGACKDHQVAAEFSPTTPPVLIAHSIAGRCDSMPSKSSLRTL